ncbi:hypothetical protein BC940DRAFT_296148 [Gongronella butleri]|nr:hypothetical protein BC940DRAFT_296148 [Gongronella butleri]
MFKRMQSKPSKTSFQLVTPNSRTIPMAEEAAYHAMTTPNEAPDYDPSSIYDTYGHESFHQPPPPPAPAKKITIQTTGTSRQTFIEPNKSTMVKSPVTPQSMYGPPSNLAMASNVGNMNFFQSASEVDALSEQQRSQDRPPTIIQPRMQRAEMAVKFGQVQQPLEASHASIEHAAAATMHSNKYYYAEADNYDYAYQPQPQSTHSNHSSTSSSSLKSSSRHHPQPLPPLVIPPSATRSVSSPTRNLKAASKTLSPPSQLTPSLTPGGSGYSPMSVSPSTPSPRSRMAANAQAHPHHPQAGGATPTTPGGSKQYHLAVANASLSTPTTATPMEKKPKSEAELLLLDGIKFHESGKLQEATHRFRQAAQLHSPMAMFFYGVSLRHGWGCQRNEQVAFQYIQRAAEHAVEDLSNLSTTVNMSAAKGELIMAIYEMGVSFRHGWGCRKNKETAVYFFRIAADLGDPDAQNDLGHCYYHGHGVKKDMYMAAKYYRKADKQGHGVMGNSWIWKPKYDHPKH